MRHNWKQWLRGVRFDDHLRNKGMEVVRFMRMPKDEACDNARPFYLDGDMPDLSGLDAWFTALTISTPIHGKTLRNTTLPPRKTSFAWPVNRE